MMLNINQILLMKKGIYFKDEFHDIEGSIYVSVIVLVKNSDEEEIIVYNI